MLVAKDPFLDLAAALAPLDKQIRDAQKTRAGATSRLGPVYMQAMLDKYGQMLPIATVQDLTTQITVTTLYLATTAVVWWFGTRNPSPVKK